MNLKKAYILAIISLSSLVFAQQSPEIIKNLVPNGSFENYRKKSGSIKQAIPWQQIASVDFYQEPISNDTSRFKGARTGKCYAGLRFQKNIKSLCKLSLPNLCIAELPMNMKCIFDWLFGAMPV